MKYVLEMVALALCYTKGMEEGKCIRSVGAQGGLGPCNTLGIRHGVERTSVCKVSITKVGLVPSSEVPI
jgi:hypothetical protein